MQSCGTNAKLHACTPICMRQSVAALLACHDVLCQISPQDRLTLELHMLSNEVSILLASKGHQQRCVCASLIDLPNVTACMCCLSDNLHS